MSRGPSLLVCFALAACDGAGTAVKPAAGALPVDASHAQAPLRVLLFSRTEGYRHEAIEPATHAIGELPGLRVQSTEDPAELVRALPDSEVLVFLMTSGDVLDAPEQQALEGYVRGGGGFVGVHSAADTEYDWPFYGTLVGAWFKDHPAIQRARLQVARDLSPRLDFLPESWEREDEWYNFRDDPRSEPAVRVLMTLDESSYQGGSMGPEHPIAWCRDLDAGRSFYTGLGHTLASWQDPLFMQHIAAGLRWAARR